MRKFIKKAVAIALSVITAMSTFAVCTTGASAATDDGNVGAGGVSVDVTQTVSYRYNSNYLSSGYVFKKDNDGSDWIYCTEPTVASPLGDTMGATKNFAGSSEVQGVTNRKLLKVLYYGFGGPGFEVKNGGKAKMDELKTKYPDLCDSEDIKYFYYALTHTSTAQAENNNNQIVSFGNWKTASEEFVDFINEKSDVGNQMKAYYLISKNAQKLVYPVFTKKLKLFKGSERPEYTNGNSNYDLTGAKYAIFDDYSKAGKASVGTTTNERIAGSLPNNIVIGDGTTNHSGYYGVHNPNTGERTKTYYVDSYKTFYAVEYIAPKGYKLRNKVYTFADSGITDSDGVPIYQAVANDYPKYMYLKLTKTSDNPELTKDNSCYSLEGTKYAIFDSKEKAIAATKDNTWEVRTKGSLPSNILTNADGVGWYNSTRTEPTMVPLGTYYAVEYVAPKGYTLSDEVIQFKNSGKDDGNGNAYYEATCSDTPESDPIGVMLQKKSTTGLQAESGDLAGAEFEVSYYDVDPNVVTSLEELQKTGKSPLRTWVFKTNKYGIARYDNSYKVSGPELYYDEKNKPNLPHGAVTFKEITAPTSGKYLINEETFFTTVTGDEGDVEEVNLDIIVPEVPATAGLTIQKSSEDGIVEGLWFRIEGTNGYTNDFATNALGTISVEGLDVYDGNGKKISYTITELGIKNSDGKYTLPKRYKATEPKTVTLDETKNVVVRFENKVINGGINIVKTSDDGKVENIYFEIKGSNGIVRKVVTDKNGKVSISALPVYDNDNNVVSYTVKELGIKNGDGTYSIPKKYIVPKPQTVTLNSGTQDLGLVKTINVQNKIVKGSLEINKTSTDGKIEGIWFNVTGTNGIVRNVVTDKNGNITITDLDVYDDTDKKIEYTIKELGIKDASGKIIFPAYYFDVDDVQVTLEENTTTTAPTFENKNKLGQIRITKQGMDGEVNGFTFRVSSVTDGYTYNEIFTQKSISGIRVRNLQPFLADGTPIEYKIEEVGFRYPSKTYADNEYDPLPARYIKVADQYVQWATEADLSDTNISTKYITLRNFLKRGNLEIIKESEDGKVEGIWFEVKDAAYENAESYKACTDATGRVRFEGLDVYRGNNDLVEYTITELGEKQADGTYKIPFKYNTPTTQTVTINYDETTQAGFASTTFTNTLKTGSISIEKVDIGGKGVDGARFVVTKKSDNAVVGKITTDANGKGSITGLAQGDYRIVEERTKGGFNLLKSYKDVSITGDNEQTLNYTYHVRETLLPELPLTGGDNLTLGMMGIGSLIFAVGVIICAKHYKKSKRLGNA